MRGSKAIAPVLLLAAAPFTLDAAGRTPQGEGVQDEGVVITATRTARTVDETLASVTVINRADIERSQAQSVQELLRGVPGVSVANNGGAGKLTTVFLRGTESDHVLVLIDGVKIGSPTAGLAAFQDIPVELIDRIEVVRGPRSSLYGSEAIGGVIQIFTKKGAGPVKPSFSIGGGSYGTVNGSAGLSGGVGNGWFSANLSGLDTRGFNACNGEPLVGGCFTSEPDRDGYRNVAGSARAGWRFENGASLDVNWLRSKANVEYDGSFADESDTVQQVFGANLRFSPLAAWRVGLAAGQSRDESDNFKNGVFVTRFDTRRDTLSWQNDVTVADGHLATLGLDWQDDRVESTTRYALTSRDNTGVFGQYQGAFGAGDVQLSLRHDENEQFGSHTTGGAALGHAITPALRVLASYGTAFKAPTFNELYFPGFSNPNLRPEESQSIEIGVNGRHGWGRWSLNAYETRVDDLIAYDASLFAPNNIDEARIRGLEAIVGARLGHWELSATATLLDPENRSPGANNGKVLPRRARESGRLDIDRAFDRYRVGATLRAEGQRYDDLANRVVLAGYGTLDLRGEVLLAKAWRVQASLVNLFDRDYETAAYYNQPGLSGYITLRYQP